MTMTAEQLARLRQKARSASAGDWKKESGDGWEAVSSSDDQANGGFIIAHFEGPDAKANREFMQAATPNVVLALLDELESTKRDSARWFKAFEKAVSVGARYEERIAELEARTVALSKPQMVKHVSGEIIHCWPAYTVDSAIRAAGINLTVEG